MLSGSDAAMTGDIIADVKPPVSRIAVAVLTVMIAAASMAVRLFWIERVNPDIDPKGWGAVPFAVLFGLGVSVVVVLAWANRHRWRIVLKPNKGRIIGAYVLGFLTPFAVFSWLP